MSNRELPVLRSDAIPAWRLNGSKPLLQFARDFLGDLKQRWAALSLAAQFVLAAAVVILTGMAIFGSWVAGRIERGVVEHASANSSLHLDTFIEPHVQSLARSEPLSSEAERQLSALVLPSSAAKTIKSVTIWASDGTVIFSTIPRLAGEKRLMPAKVAKAWLGGIEDKFEMVTPEGGSGRGSTAEPILKLYAPLHERLTGRIIAVAEVHESAAQLANEIKRTRLQTAGALALLSLAMLGTLSRIVRRGGQTIVAQRAALRERVRDLSTALAKNDELQTRVIEANRRSVDTNDRLLRRLGAELHDGPVQLVALALLRLESLKPKGEEADGLAGEDFNAVESALRDALKEIRGLSSGLALPKLEGATVAQAIEYAVRNHERRSRTRVQIQIDPKLPVSAPPLLLACIYRFAQEGLTNAFRHAGGKGQSVRAAVEGSQIVVEVSDDGPGMPEPSGDMEDDTKGLGLRGLTDRVESLNGVLEVVSSPCSGTKLRVSFDRSEFESVEVKGA